MPRRFVQLASGDFCHIVKRGVEQRKIFLQEQDYLRFVNSLLVFNDKYPAPWSARAFWEESSPENLSKTDYKPKQPLVEIHAFALMPNHFHLLVRQITDNGIRIFMQKLGGYVLYFNKKYQRQGPLFQGRYIMVHIDDEDQLRNTFVYVSTNPLSLIESGWKNWKVRDVLKAMEFLKNGYRWASNWDYFEKENFPGLMKKDFFLGIFGGKKGIENDIRLWIEHKHDIFQDEERLRLIAVE